MFEKPRVVSNLEFQENWELCVNIHNGKKNQELSVNFENPRILYKK